MTKVTVLLCEDEPLISMEEQDIIEQTLAEIGLQTSLHHYFNGQGALDYLRQQPDRSNIILITDNTMPDMPGYKLLPTLDREGLLPKHVAVCSASTAQQFKAQAGHIEKPIQFLQKPIYRNAMVEYLRQAGSTLMADCQMSGSVNNSQGGLTSRPS